MSRPVAHTYSADVRAKAVARLLEEESKFPTRYAAAKAIGSEIGCSSSSLLSWVATAERSQKGGKTLQKSARKKGAQEKVAAPSAATPTDPAAVFDDVMEKADIQRQNGKLEKAEELYQQALALNTGRIGPLVFLARIWRELGQMQKSEAAYGEVLAKRPDSFEALRALGDHAVRRQDGQAALPFYARAFALDPKDARVRRETGRLSLEFGDLALAETAYDAMTDTPDEKVSGLRATAARHLALRNYEAAKRCLDAALAVKPDDPALALSAARCLRNLHRFEEARTQIRHLMAHTHVTLDILREYGALLEAMGDPAGALDILKKAQEVFGRDKVIEASISRCLAKTGRVDDARAAWEARLTADPTSTEALKALAGLAEKAGKPDEAYAFYSRALAIAPDDHGLRIHLARRYAAHDPSVKIEDVYRSAVDAGYRNPTALTGLGNVAARDGRLEEALAFYTESRDKGDASTRLTLALASVHHKLRQMEKAKSLYQDVLTQEPGSIGALNGLARLLAAGGQPDNAIGLYQQLIAIEPHNSSARLGLARAYRATHQFEEARKQCSLLADDPDSRADAEHERILCLQAEGRQPESFRAH